MKKRIFSAAIAATLAVSALSTTAFADDPSTVLNGVTKVPTIDVTVPADDGFLINPYALDLSSYGVPSANKTNKIIPGYLITGGNSWTVINNTIGSQIDLSMFAVVTENGNLQVNATSGGAFSGGSVDNTKNQLTLKLCADLLSETLGTTEITLLHEAPEWTATSGILTKTMAACPANGNVTNAGKVGITLTCDNDNGLTICSAGWTEEDTASIKISYKFGVHTGD